MHGSTGSRRRPQTSTRGPIRFAPASWKDVSCPASTGIFPEQAESVRRLSNDELVRFRFEDPISSHGIKGGIQLTGGHHRTAEIIRRVKAGELSPDTELHLLLHD